MITLVGKFSRSEDDCKVVKHEPRNTVLWEIEQEEGDPLGCFVITLRCPSCGHVSRFRGTLDEIEEAIEKFYTSLSNARAYCCYCGHQNIIFKNNR